MSYPKEYLDGCDKAYSACLELYSNSYNSLDKEEKEYMLGLIKMLLKIKRGLPF